MSKPKGYKNKEAKKQKQGRIGSTKQEERKVLSAGDIDKEGITVKPIGIENHISEEYGKYWSMEAILYKDGEQEGIVLNFGGKRLHDLIEENWEAIKGTKIRIEGYGEGYERYYEVYQE